jgi:hypothetical protein
MAGGLELNFSLVNHFSFLPKVGRAGQILSLTRSAFDRVIAHRLPAQNQIPFLRASGSLTCGAIMDMDVRSPIRNSIIHRHVTLKPLVQIPRLSNVDGNPGAVLALLGINEIAWQRLENSVNGMNLVWILFARLPGPPHGLGVRALRLRVMTK